MADRKPLKVLPDSASGTGGGDSTGIGEFVAGDTLGVVDGGTGLATVATDNILTGNGTSALSAESDLTFASNKLTVFGTTGTGTAPPAVINLSTRETTVVENDQLGRIDFQAPFESDSPDARLVAASISAVADNTFASGINTTDLVLATANSEAATEKMRVGAAGYIGMGISSPQTYISVPGLVVGGTSANSEICLVSGTSNSALLGFTDTADSTNQGMIAYEHGSVNAMKFYTNGETERMRILSGGGITFNGDTAAANALDDYEEGTFTPVLRYADTNYSASGSEGQYIKIGRMVYYSASITITNAAVSNDSSTLDVSGMPYTIENNSPTGHARQICTIQYYTGGTTILNVVAYGVINTSTVDLLILFNNGGAWQGVPSSHIYQSSNNNNVFLTGCYTTA